ncbi:hypothetical protein CLAFUW4_08378 [Fulvia fulva]|uniref:Uncharacterized protein n=1 Tax=Passalora fulva TaxID=5499 RepID=A0A9Q8LCS2_PASFU|nr:uncharacterized protein CLAFUR5_08483 [Fulvia fulva]KAK4628948.1 hypothetical protein CLAFUR4_08383 [Fulvia fulva]KAK4630280.1 hypothetical protein CLAFUR0_08378 [Fulvia fulva]UJO14995.1 hypothetical protein CLAFUR5_08483 [Fulvia fulva]WPV12663.1 hypothetical protein CLAFUW4_08378 [Fulvia fulva]WPV27942.1 hypothetical protein CLAFUW7_08378 [Fulvia fulva]
MGTAVLWDDTPQPWSPLTDHQTWHDWALDLDVANMPRGADDFLELDLSNDDDGAQFPTSAPASLEADKIPYANPGSSRHDGSTTNPPEAELVKLPLTGQYPNVITSPDKMISHEQLAAEVKGIYAGLVMVEAKCINVDARQQSSKDPQLGEHQWQALIALHTTLLYEHHHFLMVSQSAAVNCGVRDLAAKYSMPARMWEHGIHDFLEFLWKRRPEESRLHACLHLSSLPNDGLTA